MWTSTLRAALRQALPHPVGMKRGLVPPEDLVAANRFSATTAVTLRPVALLRIISNGRSSAVGLVTPL